MSDITSIAPYEPVTIQDTTDENRTDLVALLQRQEDEIALQNQVIRQILQHWDSISHCVTLEHAHDDFADLNSARIFARNNGSVGLTVELKNGKWGSATLYDDERLK